MKITKQSTFGNTSIVGNITYRLLGTYLVVIGLGFLLFMSPLFRWNLFAMAAYIALASIVVGQTPTGRSVFMNMYGVVFKKPIRMVVSEQATMTTLGHGIREVVKEDDIDTSAFKMFNGNYALVYNVTSSLNNWSTPQDYQNHAVGIKNLFNVLEGGEGLVVATKRDSDTGMLQLRDYLMKHEEFEGDDFAAMSARRQELLVRVATSDVGRSVQQYVILQVKPRNVKRVVAALQKSTRIIRPATNPGDVLLSVMGYEGGVDYTPVDVDNIDLEKEGEE